VKFPPDRRAAARAKLDEFGTHGIVILQKQVALKRDLQITFS
jgi:hypothetical protein